MSHRGPARNIRDHEISAGGAEPGLAGDGKIDRVAERLREAGNLDVAGIKRPAIVRIINDAEGGQIRGGRRAGRGELQAREIHAATGRRQLKPKQRHVVVANDDVADGGCPGVVNGHGRTRIAWTTTNTSSASSGKW